MPVEVLILVVLAAIANLAVLTAIAVPLLVRARRARGERLEAGLADEPRVTGTMEISEPPASAPLAPEATYEAGVPRSAYDRVIRVTAWTFILFSVSLVVLSGLWAPARPAIVVVLAIAGALVLLVHDLLPPRIRGVAAFLVEGAGAISLITLVVGLTGGATSPFFFAYPLVVVGAALVVEARVTIALAVVSVLAYGSVALGPNVAAGTTPETLALATVAVDVTALGLLAYVASFVAREQRRSRDAAIRLSTIDSLTGLFNRSYFFTSLEREIARSDRSGRRFCLLMMDLDGLKATNDKHGHFVGDRVLRGVGDVVRRSVRKIDTPARYGGDEFVVLLPETDPSGAFVVAEKIRQGVAERTYEAGSRASGGETIRASVSVGVVTYPDDGGTADELMISADKAMYASKESGKNRVIDYASARSSGGTRTGGGGKAGIR